MLQIDEMAQKAEDLSITWTVEYAKDGETDFRYAVRLKNNGETPLIGRQWGLYFNFSYGIVPEKASPNVKVTHINGDFYEIRPSDLFESLDPGQTMVISLESRSLAFKESDAPTGFYFVFDRDMQSPPQSIVDFKVEPDIEANQTMRSESDHILVPTPASRYRDNRDLTKLRPDEIPPVLPTPVWYKRGSGKWLLDSTSIVYWEPGLESEAHFLVNALLEQTGVDLKKATSPEKNSRVIGLRIARISVDGKVRESGDEAYRLNISQQGGVEISGSDKAGLFYGIQSLLAQVPVSGLNSHTDGIYLPEIEMLDAPRFPYRGFMLDVSRNFQSKESVLKLLDLMAVYKLNKFHFHLADDEGWRLQINGLPELTEVGARRGHSMDESDRLIPSFGSGPYPSESKTFYTRTDFIEILRFSQARHIEVIPEIDLPGHARAAIKSMEARYNRLRKSKSEEEAGSRRLVDPLDKSTYRSVQGWDDNVINVCQQSTYRFIEAVIDDLIDIYHEAGAPLRMIHIGGDEVPQGVWTASPACEKLIESQAGLSGVEDLAQYFRHRITEMLRKRGLKAGGWQEIALKESIQGDKKSMAPNPDFSESVIPYYWYNVWGRGYEDIGYKLANAGFKVVMSCATNLYFDLAYDKDPKEPGYFWAGAVDTREIYELIPFDIYKSAGIDDMGIPVDLNDYQNASRLTSEGQENILGIQGQLWGEKLTSQERMEYMAFPKLLGLAERAWARQQAWATIDHPERRNEMLSQDWNAFANCLGQRELVRLDNYKGGVAYRIPLPGAIMEDGLLKANVRFPGLEIRYTTDGSEPTITSLRYTGPVEVKTEMVKLKTFDTRGRSSRTSTIP